MNTTLKFDLTLEDLREFRNRHFLKYRMLKILLILTGGLAVVEITSYKPGIDPAVFLQNSAFGLVLYGLLFWVYRRNETRLPANAAAVVGSVEMVVTEHSISGIDRDGDGTLNWAELAKVYIAPQALYLYVNASIAVIVPRRAFANADEARAFGTFLRHKLARVDS